MVGGFMADRRASHSFPSGSDLKRNLGHDVDVGPHLDRARAFPARFECSLSKIIGESLDTSVHSWQGLGRVSG